MIKIIHILTTFLYSGFFSHQASSKRPARLDKKQQNKISFETLCRKACPYILFACGIILCVLLFIALVKYGHSFSTEANNYYYNL